MRNILLVFVCIIFTVTASAQKTVIKGRIYDSIRHEGLAWFTPAEVSGVVVIKSLIDLSKQ